MLHNLYKKPRNQVKNANLISVPSEKEITYHLIMFSKDEQGAVKP
jgi:hypothetical protein